MKTLFYITAFILITISVFFNVSAYAAGSGTDGSGSWTPLPDPSMGGGGGGFGGGGTGHNWGNDGGFGGNGGSNATCETEMLYTRNPVRGITFPKFKTGQEICEWTTPGLTFRGNACYRPDGSLQVYVRTVSNPDYDSSCINPDKGLKCPAGYKQEGDKCIWQCPAGYKDMGGSCVKDDMPEDCDPLIQECNDDGTPKCDPCSKLQELISNNQTMINNDNRVISLTETLVSNQNTTNNNINNVNNSLSVINNNMSTINNNINNVNSSIQNVITAIEDNKPDFDTTAIENKLDEVVNAIQNNNGVGDDGQPIDLTEIIRLLNEIDVGVKDSKFDDTQLNAYFDEILEKGIPVGVDFTDVTDRQDDQTGLLKDIKKLLMPTNEAGDPDFGIPEVGEFDAHLDPWSAIRGFDINQNMINAEAQCPSGEAYSFTVMGKTFDMPMTIMCNFLGQIGVGIMFLAYMSGAFIIVKGD